MRLQEQPSGEKECGSDRQRMPNPFWLRPWGQRSHITEHPQLRQGALAFAFSVLVLRVKTAETVLQVKERTITPQPTFFKPLISTSMQHELTLLGRNFTFLCSAMLSSPGRKVSKGGLLEERKKIQMWLLAHSWNILPGLWELTQPDHLKWFKWKQRCHRVPVKRSAWEGKLGQWHGGLVF